MPRACVYIGRSLPPPPALFMGEATKTGGDAAMARTRSIGVKSAEVNCVSELIIAGEPTTFANNISL